MLKTPVVVCLLIAAALAAGCNADEGSDDEPQSAKTGTAESSDESTATGSRHTDASKAGFECDPADANRPDRPRGDMVAGTIPAPVPRRTCTLPQRGCVAAPGGQGVVGPPVPGIDVIRITENSIGLAYDLGSDLDECQPSQLRVTVHTTISGLPPNGDDYPVPNRTGTLRIARKQLPGSIDYGPPDVLAVSSTTGRGFSSGSAIVALPPAEGEAPLSDAERRQIAARREACRADINDRTNCVLDRGALHPVSGPVTEATPAALAQSVRRSIEGDLGANFQITDLKCFNGTRCDAAFTTGSSLLEMSYRVEALQSVPTCWELTAFSVTRPVPELGGLAAPVPHSGCTDR